GRCCDGAVVNPGRLVAAAAADLRVKGPQPRVRDRHESAGRSGVPRIPRTGPDNALSRIVPRGRRHDLRLRYIHEQPLPLDPTEVGPEPGAIDRLEALCASVSPVLASARVLARQACYRPVTRDGLPLIGAVPGVAGAYVATGHSVWGILNAPATGEAVAELII